MTAKGLHDPIVNQYRPRHRICGCYWPSAQAADCWDSVNASGVSSIHSGCGDRGVPQMAQIRTPQSPVP